MKRTKYGPLSAIGLALLAAALGCTDPEPHAVNTPTIRLECSAGQVEIVLENLPWFARGLFVGGQAFVLDQSSENGGTINFQYPVATTLGSVLETDDGLVGWGWPEYEPSEDDSATVCQRLGGTASAWRNCWRVCCRLGGAAPHLLAEAACSAQNGEVVPMEECVDSHWVCCKRFGNDADGPVSLQTAGECVQNDGLPVDPSYCSCCYVTDSGFEVAGTGAAILHIEDLTEALVSNDCDDDLNGVAYSWHFCSEETRPTPPCQVGSGGACEEVCCNTGQGHALRRKGQCAADAVIRSADCEFQASCCTLTQGAQVTYESVTGNRRGRVEGVTSFTHGQPGTVTIRLQQLWGSVVLFEEASPGSSVCTVEVPAPEPVGIDLTGTWELVWSCDDTCFDEVLKGSELLYMQQTGTDVTWSDDTGFDYSGTLDGSTVTFSGGGVGYETSGTLEVSPDANHFTKASTYTQTLEGTTCKGVCTGMAGRYY